MTAKLMRATLELIMNYECFTLIGSKGKRY